MGKHGRKLTAAFVRSVHEPGLYWDEHGLVLRVKPSGYKQWIQRLFIHGKRRELGLGPVRLVTLAEARDAALANRKVARAGGDPRATRRRSVPTFERAAAKVFAMHRTSWSAKHAAQWASTLRMYVHPRIGGKRVDRITSADVMGVLMPIWSAKHTTAKRVRERIGTVMKWAIAQGYRVDNPAGEAIRAALPKPGHIQKHLKAPLPKAQNAAEVRCPDQLTRNGSGRWPSWRQPGREAIRVRLPKSFVGGGVSALREAAVPMPPLKTPQGSGKAVQADVGCHLRFGRKIHTK